MEPAFFHVAWGMRHAQTAVQYSFTIKLINLINGLRRREGINNKHIRGGFCQQGHLVARTLMRISQCQGTPLCQEAPRAPAKMLAECPWLSLKRVAQLYWDICLPAEYFPQKEIRQRMLHLVAALPTCDLHRVPLLCPASWGKSLLSLLLLQSSV